MTASIKVEGADRLAATLGAAARKLEQLAAVNRELAGRILAGAHPPRRTGALASSLTAEGTDTEAVVSSALNYAPIIERGSVRRGIAPRRFLEAAAEAEEASALRLHLDHINGCLATVKGA